MNPPVAPARVAIVLVNWKAWRDCIECLSSIAGSGALAQADVWLVDNDSGDGSVEHIAAWCQDPQPAATWARLDGVRHHPAGVPLPCRVWQGNGEPAPLLPGVQVNLVRAGGNLGFAGGNNVGMAAAGLARYSHFWLLNTDTVMAHDALTQLLQRAQGDDSVGQVGSTLLYYGRPDTVQALGGGSLDRAALRMSHIGELRRASEVPASAEAVRAVEAQMAYVVGASMLVPARYVRDVGPMCEDYFLYFEELDWAFRGRAHWTLGYAPASRVFHKVGGSSMQTASEFSLNLLYRNQVRFAARFLPEVLPSLKRVLVWELVRHVLKRRWMPARLVARTLADARALAASATAQERPA